MNIHRYFRFTSVILLFLLLNTSGNAADSLRFFPEISGKKLHSFSVANSDYVVAFGNGDLYYWDGNSWHFFDPPFPLPEAQVSFIQAFSPANIWVFYQKRSYDFHSECYHFDGKKWVSINMPQLNDLEHFSFIDDHRFYAAGHWGSLIYYNGKKAVNIRNNSGVCFSFLQGFNPKLFYAAYRPYENKSFVEMYKVENGKWEKIFELKSDISRAHFFKQDSGIVLDGGIKKRYLYKYSKHTLIKIDSLEYNYEISLNDSVFYYYKDKWVWRYNLKNKRALFAVDIPVSIILLNENEFLLQSDHNRLFYWGKKKTGHSVNVQKPLFFKRYYYGMDGGGYMGTALYRNINKNLEVYFTAVTDNNMFISFTDTTNPKISKDVLLTRNLLGFGKEDKPGIKWDAGVYFADLDNDGDKDAILTAFRGGCQLYENTGADRFENVTDLYEFSLNGRIKEVQWVDLNHDNRIDFIAGVGRGALRIFLNQGFFRFKEISYKNVIPDSLCSFQPALADMDGDGDLDLFVYRSNKSIRYFENQTKQELNAQPVFAEKSNKSPELTTRFDFFPQSISFADYDNDGDLDLLLVNRVTPLKLFENDGNGVFTDVSRQKGFHYHFLAYGSNWGDLDQDGFQDIFISTVGKNYIFWNKGSRYFEVDSTSLAANKKSHSSGSIMHDMDSDGDLDIVVTNNYYGYSEIQKNMYNEKNFIKIELINGNNVGTKIWIYAQGHSGSKDFLKGFREISLNTGFCSSTLPDAYFGLPADSSYDILIRYPSGEKQRLNSVPVGTTVKVASPSSVHNLIVYRLKSILFNARQRRQFSNIIYFVVLIFFFNWYTRRKYMWALFPTLFFNISLLSIYFFSRILSAQNSVWVQNYIPLYSVLITGIVLFYLINHYNRLLLKDEHYFELFDLLRQFNHSKSGLKYIDHLLFLCNNFEVNNSTRQKEGLTEFQFFLKNTDPLLSNLNQFYARLYQKNMLRKRIIHIRKMLKNSLKHFDVLPGTIKMLKLELLQLKDLLSEMRLNVESQFNTDIIIGLTSSINNFPQLTRVSFQNNSGQSKLFAVIPDKDFIQIIGNVLQNALEAMEGLQEKPIDISIDQRDALSVQICIRDYGKGLPLIDNEKLFEMGQSTKNSTGLGLYHSRKLLEPFGGKIKLYSVLPEKGTEVLLNLRLHNENNHFDD